VKLRTRRKEFSITDTLESNMATVAMMGFSMPATAKLIPTELIVCGRETM